MKQPIADRSLAERLEHILAELAALLQIIPNLDERIATLKFVDACLQCLLH